MLFQNDKPLVVPQAVITKKKPTHYTSMDGLDDGLPLTSTPVSKIKQQHRIFPPIYSPSNNKENESTLNTDFDNMLDDLKEKLGKAESEVEYWKKKYYKLFNSKTYPLTEGTGQKLTNLLNQFGNTKFMKI